MNNSPSKEQPPLAPAAAPPPLSLSAQLLLARLDLETERVLATAEALVIANANREAQLISQEERNGAS